jgi:hypothetical protein
MKQSERFHPVLNGWNSFEEASSHVISNGNLAKNLIHSALILLEDDRLVT